MKNLFIEHGELVEITITHKGGWTCKKIFAFEIDEMIISDDGEKAIGYKVSVQETSASNDTK